MIIKEIVLEKILVNVIYMTKHSAKKPPYLFIKELILEKNLSSVIYVRNLLLQVPSYRII
jgi:hypothetical protein